MRQRRGRILVNNTIAQIITWATAALFFFQRFVDRQTRSFDVLSYVFGALALILISLLIASSRNRNVKNRAMNWLRRLIDLLEPATVIIVVIIFIADVYDLLILFAEPEKLTQVGAALLPTIYTLILLILLIIFWSLYIVWNRKKLIGGIILFAFVIVVLNWSTIYPWIVSAYRSLLFL